MAEGWGRGWRRACGGFWGRRLGFDDWIDRCIGHCQAGYLQSIGVSRVHLTGHINQISHHARVFRKRRLVLLVQSANCSPNPPTDATLANRPPTSAAIEDDIVKRIRKDILAPLSEATSTHPSWPLDRVKRPVPCGRAVIQTL